MNAEKRQTRRKETETCIRRQKRLVESSPYIRKTSSPEKHKEFRLMDFTKRIQNYPLPYQIVVKSRRVIFLLINLKMQWETFYKKLRFNRKKETHEIGGDIPIFRAIRQFSGDMKKINELLKGIGALTGRSENVLHAAVTAVADPSCRQHLVEFLVKEKPDLVGEADVFGKTPLHSAIECKAGENLIRFLLDHGALPHVPDKKGNTPLHYAAEHHPAVIKLLLARGAGANVENNLEETVLYTALLCAFATGEHLKCIEDLLSSGAKIYRSDLAFANYHSDIELLKLLLKYGGDPNKLLSEPATFPNDDHFELLMQYALFRRFRSAKRHLRSEKLGRAIWVASEEQKNKMESFMQSCLKEIEQMANEPMLDGSSLYSFICENYPVNRVESKSLVPDHVLQRVYHYPSCRELILLSIPLESLILKARTVHIYCTSDDAKEKVYLNSLCVDHVLKYVEKKEDLLNLIVAFIDDSPTRVLR